MSTTTLIILGLIFFAAPFVLVALNTILTVFEIKSSRSNLFWIYSGNGSQYNKLPDWAINQCQLMLQNGTGDKEALNALLNIAYNHSNRDYIIKNLSDSECDRLWSAIKDVRQKEQQRMRDEIHNFKSG